MHHSRVFTLIAVLFLSVFSVLAQSGTIRGFVYEKETGEPALFTNVYLRGTTIGSSTDVNGYFSITRIPPGNYDLIVSFIGFDSLVTPVTVKGDDIQTLKLYVEKKSVDIGTVEVTAERQEARSEVQVSVTKVTPREIKQLPSIGGQPDLAQYLQILPGVVFTGDQGGQLYIRGGTPIQNKVLLDGMIVYNPFHSIGLFSVFDTDIIRNADVYTGGFSAEYGDRISSVMDITTREGNKNRYGGKFGVSPFTSRLLVEGPIRKARQQGGGNSSFILSTKASFLEETSKVLYEYADTAGLPYNFFDIYGKVSLNADNGSKLNLFGFRFQDDVDYPGIAQLGWNSMGFGTSFVLVPGGSTVLIDGNFAFSNYAIELSEQDLQPRSSEINGFNLGMGFTYFLGRDQIKYGFELLGFKTNFNFYNNLGVRYSQEENTTEIGAFVKYKKLLGSKVVLDPSVRFQYYASLSEFTIEPRLGLKYNVTDRLRLKFAGGFYSQNFISASSDRDVVNLFYGFLSGPDNLPAKFDGENVDSKLQKARHAIAGFEVDLPYHFSLNIEGYIKEFTQLTNLNRDKIFEDNA
ncbi:MAG: TonB-dependent receptor, partial [Bacteroidia bacterium]